MSKKRKLESSLEGLFSKSKGKEKLHEKTQDEFIPTHPAGPAARENEDSTPASGMPIPAASEGKKTASKTVGNSTPPVKTARVHTEKANPAPKAVSSEPTKADPMPQTDPTPPAQQPARAEAAQSLQPAEKLPEPAAEPVIPMGVDPEPALNPEPVALAKVTPVKQALAVVEKEEAEKQLLIFRIGDVDYAVEVELVQTIIKPQTVFLVPGTDEFIKGLINLRGEVVPVVDLHTRFNLPPREMDKNTRFVVIEIGELKASLVVDAVQGVVTIPVSTIEKPSNIVSDVETRYLKGIARLDNQLVLILDMRQTIRIGVEE